MDSQLMRWPLIYILDSDQKQRLSILHSIFQPTFIFESKEREREGGTVWNIASNMNRWTRYILPSSRYHRSPRPRLSPDFEFSHIFFYPSDDLGKTIDLHTRAVIFHFFWVISDSERTVLTANRDQQLSSVRRNNAQVIKFSKRHHYNSRLRISQSHYPSCWK